ncbi:MAG: hypothetical protein ACRD06_07680, partial [Terriglobia bacterium]
SRGDLVTVENIPFTITPLEASPPLYGLKRIGPFLNQYGEFVRYIILALFGLLIFLFVVKPLIRQLGVAPPALPGLPAGGLQHALAGAGGAGALPESATALDEASIPAAAGGMSGEKQKFTQIREDLVAKVAKTPAEAGRLVEGWLHEDDD